MQIIYDLYNFIYNSVISIFLLGPAYGRVCVLFREKKGAVAGKRSTFLYTSPYEHVKYKVWGPYVKYFRLLKVFRKNIPSRLNIVIRAKRVLVGIMLAQRRRQWPTITSTLCQCIMLSGVSGARSASPA